MNDERRAAPAPATLDAAPGDSGMSSPSPAPSNDAQGALSAAADGGASRLRGRDAAAGLRRRPRMALRIPDDEVARPQTPSTPDAVPVEVDAVASTPPPPESFAVLTPTPIISINPEPPPADASESPARDTPVEPDSVEVKFEDDALTPRLPAVRTVPPPDAVVAPEGAPPADGAAVRPHESHDGELSADDLVVDPTPSPARVAATLPSMRPRLPSQAPIPPPTARRPAPSSPRSGRAPLVIVPPHVGNVGQDARDASGLRRKGRFWWEDLFNDDYLRATEHLTEEQLAAEVNFIEESLGIERGGAVLDLACGTGRHAVELSKRGYEVVGFDLSLSMLAKASEEAQERAAKLNFLQGDMREMTFAEQFDGVYCWNTSFGYFEEEKNAQVIDRIRAGLKAGGQLLLDVANRDFVIRQSPSLAWFEGDGCVCMDEMVVDFITSRLRIKRTMMLDDGRSREIEYSLRLYSLHELGKMLHEHGFKVCEVSGRIATPGVFFGHESPRTIILAEKR